MEPRRRLSGLTLALATLALATSTTAVGQSEDTVGTSISSPEPFTAWLACGQDVGLNTPSTRISDDETGTSVSDAPRTIWRFRPLQVSDPRMDGMTYGYLAGTEWANDSWSDDIGVYSALWHVVNDGGEWIGPYTTLHAPEVGWATNSVRLEGSGDYQGLYAVIQADFRDDCGWDVTGYILERDVPAFPGAAPELSK